MACAAISDKSAGTRARQRLSKNGCPSISPRTHRYINPLRQRAAVVCERVNLTRVLAPITVVLVLVLADC